MARKTTWVALGSLLVLIPLLEMSFDLKRLEGG